MHRQQNNSDCGIYAAAFATSLAVGNDPLSIRYECNIRSHLANCLEVGQQTPFGNKIIQARLPRIVHSKNVDIYCECRGTDDGSLMVQCDTCKKWFHMQCVNDNKNTTTEWFCRQCL